MKTVKLDEDQVLSWYLAVRNGSSALVTPEVQAEWNLAWVLRAWMELRWFADSGEDFGERADREIGIIGARLTALPISWALARILQSPTDISQRLVRIWEFVIVLEHRLRDISSAALVMPQDKSSVEGALLLFASASSATIAGIDGVVVRVEVDVAGGLPGLEIVGLADPSVREARHRVRSALHNAGAGLPPRRITVNLSPASLHKEGPQMDVGIAAGILAASGQVPTGPRLTGYCFLGELALDGAVRPVKGVLAMVLAAAGAGLKGAVVPRENQGEVAFLSGLDLLAAGSLAELAGFLRGASDLPMVESGVAVEHAGANGTVDFADIRGQGTAKRAIEVSCSGGHNVLMSGPPGAGKSMLARAMPGILPELTQEESLVVTRIHSVAGILPEGQGLVRARPFRAPHHTATASALVGGGVSPRPGEVTLAHRGVLFLDELPLFPPSVLNALRQPLEDGETVVTRSRATHRFPSRFLLAAAMNPCPCEA